MLWQVLFQNKVKNKLECKFDAYISKASGLTPAKITPARCTATKKTKTNPL